MAADHERRLTVTLEWLIIAALCCGVHGQLVFSFPTDRYDKATCEQVAEQMALEYPERGTLVRCRPAH